MSDKMGNQETSKNFTTALKQGLRARDWSQKKLAAFIGKDESTVSLWLSGRHGPRLDDEVTIRKLADFLHLEGVEVEQLLAAQKKEKRVDEKPDVERRIHSLRELERVIREELPTFFDQAMYLNTYIRPEGLRERLWEKGYIVNKTNVQELLKRMCQRPDLFPLDDTYIVDHEDGGFTRTTRTKGTMEAQNTVKTRVRVRARGRVKGFVKEAEPALTLFSRRFGDDELLDRFKSYFRGEEWVRDTIRQICRRLNKAFKLARERLSLEEFRTEVDGVLEMVLPGVPGQLAVGQRAKDNIINAVLQALLKARFLERVGDQMVGRKWRLNGECLINGLFGIDPHIPGLNFLLDGGLLLPSSAGMIVLIKGSSGTGKTMLALELASSIAAQGHVAVYLSAEEDPNLLIERLSYIGYSQGPHHTAYKRTLERGNGKFTLITRNCIPSDTITDIASHLEDDKTGILLIVSIPNRKAFHGPQNSTLKDLSMLRQNLHKLRKEYPGQITCYILDSLEAVTDQGGRRLYEDMFGLAKHRMGLGIFVSEAQDPGDGAALQDYLVDMVIRMGYRMRTSQFKERVIEIEKCRTQNHIRGEHLFSISAGEGISMYSSIQALLSVWRRRVRKDWGPETESWKLDRQLDFDRILRGDLVRGSASLLAGPLATHKLPLGLSFLAAGLKARPGDSVLLISFREDEASILRIIQAYPQFGALLETAGETLLFSSRFKVLHIPPDYFTPERFIYRIRGILKEFRNAAAMVSRALFSNLSQLGQNSPMFKEESLFMAALIELFRKEGITSLFIDVDGKGRTEIHDIFDTIIFTNRDTTPGSDRVLVRVAHSGPGNADPTPKYLDRMTENGCGRLVLTDVERIN